MSRPRFLADHDFNEHIVSGVLRREPAVDFAHLRDLDLQETDDDEVLAFAAREGLLVVSHDVNTMTAAAARRIASGLSLAGLFLSSQATPVAAVIESLLLIWAAREAEEWQNCIEFLP